MRVPMRATPWIMQPGCSSACDNQSLPLCRVVHKSSVAPCGCLPLQFTMHMSHMLQELASAFDFVRDHFVVIASGEDKMPSIHWVLEKARAAKIQ